MFEPILRQSADRSGSFRAQPARIGQGPSDVEVHLCRLIVGLSEDQGQAINIGFIASGPSRRDDAQDPATQQRTNGRQVHRQRQGAAADDDRADAPLAHAPRLQLGNGGLTTTHRQRLALGHQSHILRLQGGRGGHRRRPARQIQNDKLRHPGEPLDDRIGAFGIELGRPVRIGKPPALRGLPEAHSTAGFATLAGLCLYAADDPIDIRSVGPSYQPTMRYTGLGLVNRVARAVRDYF